MCARTIPSPFPCPFVPVFFFCLATDGATQCYGHRGSDIFPYDILTDLITPQFTFYGKKAPNTLQNRALVRLFDPNENALPFIYDNFDWSHCAEMVSRSVGDSSPPLEVKRIRKAASIQHDLHPHLHPHPHQRKLCASVLFVVLCPYGASCVGSYMIFHSRRFRVVFVVFARAFDRKANCKLCFSCAILLPYSQP